MPATPRPLTAEERAQLPAPIATAVAALWQAYSHAEAARQDAIDQCADLVDALSAVVLAVAPVVAPGAAAEHDLRRASGTDMRRTIRALDPDDGAAVRAAMEDLTDLASTVDTLADHHTAVAALGEGASTAIETSLHALPASAFRAVLDSLLPDVPIAVLLHWLRQPVSDGPAAFAETVFRRATRTLGSSPSPEVTTALTSALTRPTWGPVAWRVTVARWLLARRPAEALIALRRAPDVVAALAPDDLALALVSSNATVRTNALLLVGSTTPALADPGPAVSTPVGGTRRGP